jgi:hypothetical protein
MLLGGIILIKFIFGLFENGWVNGTISDDLIDFRVSASYLSDGLADLIICVWKLLEGENETFCSWQEEPGEYRWLFLREGDQVKLRILWFEDTFSKYKDVKGKEMFCAYEDIIKFSRSIIRGFDKLKFEFGVDGYKQRWRYEFPEEKLDGLKSSFRILKS